MGPISAQATRAWERARRASASPAMTAVARAGLAARGVIYILIGWLAVEVALGHGSHHRPSQQGALRLLAGTPYGLVTLWLLGLGFAGYSLWRLSEAAFGVTGEGTSAGPRLKSLARAVVYAFLAYLTFAIIAGAAGSQARGQQDLTASLMHEPGGRWLVGLAGLVVLIVGLALAREGMNREFMRHLRVRQMSRKTRDVVERLGVIGITARGVVFAIVGMLIIDAAVTFDAKKSGGLDKALLTLRHQAFGPLLLLIVAAGVLIFGVYGLCEARWRRV
jgi:uncharacterized protein DUF1206